MTNLAVNPDVLAGAMNEQELIIHNLGRMINLVKEGNPLDLVLEVELKKWQERHQATLEQAAMVIK